MTLPICPRLVSQNDRHHLAYKCTCKQMNKTEFTECRVAKSQRMWNITARMCGSKWLINLCNCRWSQWRVEVKSTKITHKSSQLPHIRHHQIMYAEGCKTELRSNWFKIQRHKLVDKWSRWESPWNHSKPVKLYQAIRWLKSRPKKTFKLHSLHLKRNSSYQYFNMTRVKLKYW